MTEAVYFNSVNRHSIFYGKICTSSDDTQFHVMATYKTLFSTNKLDEVTTQSHTIASNSGDYPLIEIFYDSESFSKRSNELAAFHTDGYFLFLNYAFSELKEFKYITKFESYITSLFQLADQKTVLIKIMKIWLDDAKKKYLETCNDNTGNLFILRKSLQLLSKCSNQVITYESCGNLLHKNNSNAQNNDITLLKFEINIKEQHTCAYLLLTYVDYLPAEEIARAAEHFCTTKRNNKSFANILRKLLVNDAHITRHYKLLKHQMKHLQTVKELTSLVKLRAKESENKSTVVDLFEAGFNDLCSQLESEELTNNKSEEILEFIKLIISTYTLSSSFERQLEKIIMKIIENIKLNDKLVEMLLTIIISPNLFIFKTNELDQLGRALERDNSKEMQLLQSHLLRSDKYEKVISIRLI